MKAFNNLITYVLCADFCCCFGLLLNFIRTKGEKWNQFVSEELLSS